MTGTWRRHDDQHTWSWFEYKNRLEVNKIRFVVLHQSLCTLPSTLYYELYVRGTCSDLGNVSNLGGNLIIMLWCSPSIQTPSRTPQPFISTPTNFNRIIYNSWDCNPLQTDKPSRSRPSWTTTEQIHGQFRRVFFTSIMWAFRTFPVDFVSSLAASTKCTTVCDRANYQLVSQVCQSHHSHGTPQCARGGNWMLQWILHTKDCE